MNMNVNTSEYTINKNGEKEKVTFNYYTNLRASDKLKFVNGVTDLVVGEEHYSSIVADLIFNFMIVEVFTDVETNDIVKTPNNIDTIEDFINDTNIVDIVIENAEAGLIDSLRKAVNDDIEYKTGIHKNTLSDAITSLINTVEKQIEGIDASKLMEMAETISSLTGDITPEKLLDAYANTDMFKHNSEERENEINKNIEKAKELGLIK